MRAPQKSWFFSASILVVLACGDEAEQAGPPSPAASPPSSEPEGESPQVAPEPFVEHRVGEGETLWDIARSYGISLQKLMDDNDLTSRDVRRVRPGMTLRLLGVTEPVEVETAEDRARAREEELANLPALDDGAYHILAEGETLWDIAHAYDRSVDDIMALNDLTDDDVRSFRPGRPIGVPGIRPRDVRRVAQERPAARERERGIRHEIREGETIWDLAGAFQVSTSEIMAANRLSPDEVTSLRPGRRLFIPGVSSDSRGRVVRRMTGAQRRASRRAQALGLGTRQVASKLLRGRVERRWVRAAGGDRPPATLRWPVARGWFVRGYGSGEGGYHLATDIAGEIGWNVRAAAEGIVAYAGNEVRGYGNMVLVVHPGGLVTMYAHNSVNFVVAGQSVPRGAILAEVGSTGISRGPHVHFELMYQGKNCDPAALFRPGIRHRDGSMTPLPPVSWGRDRPEEVRCAPRRRHPRSRWVVNE